MMLGLGIAITLKAGGGVHPPAGFKFLTLNGKYLTLNGKRLMMGSSS